MCPASTHLPPVEVLWHGQWRPGWAIFRQHMPEGWRYTVEFSTGIIETAAGACRTRTRSTCGSSNDQELSSLVLPNVTPVIGSLRRSVTPESGSVTAGGSGGSTEGLPSGFSGCLWGSRRTRALHVPLGVSSWAPPPGSPQHAPLPAAYTPPPARWDRAAYQPTAPRNASRTTPGSTWTSRSSRFASESSTSSIPSSSAAGAMAAAPRRSASMRAFSTACLTRGAT